MQKRNIIQQYLQAQFRLFPINGKIPAIKNWQNTPENPFLDPNSFKKNFGVCLQNTDLVIDVDVGENKDGTKKKGKYSFKKLVNKIGLDVSKTLIVKTGAGGFHIYFKKPANFKTREKWPEYSNIEFKSRGRYVVGAECTHPVTQKEYKIVQGTLGNIQDAPTILLSLIKHIPIDFTKTSGLHQYADDVQSIKRCRAFLERAEPAVEGQEGDSGTYIIACRCRSFGLSPQAALDALVEIWNPKCKPPWDIEDLKLKVHNAYQYDEAPLGEKHPEADFKDVPVKKNYVWNSPVRKDGSRAASLLHTVNYIDINESLRPLFKYNMFTKDIEFTQKPIWYSADERLAPWTDDDAVQMKFHMETHNKYQPKTNIVHEAVLIVAKYKAYHPLRDYLNTLEWDKTERMANWLNKYVGIKEDAYSITVGTKTLLAAVARVYDPGCKYDSVLVIEGKQGVGKSRLIAALGKNWYGDIAIDPHRPDTVAAMRNKWIIEISELEVIHKAEINALKAFLSRQEDRVRLAYRKNTEDFPRQCIFIGTINPDSGCEYLRDTTGNRRFWPVKVPDRYKIDVFKLEQDVDQIWAETVYKYKNGMTELHITDEKVCILAAQEVEKRRSKDSWIPIIEEWLCINNDDGSAKNHLTGAEIYTACLDGSKKSFNRPEQIRISQIMTEELGWKKGNFFCQKRRGSVAGYTRPKGDLSLL